jgi:protein-tyrosine phosphatase
MTVPRTSITHPIRLDLIDGQVVGAPGRLGMTFAPGKKGRGIHGLWDRDLAADLARMREVYGVDTLVSLVEDHELADLHIADLADRAEAAGMAVIRFPIVDVSVPRDQAAFAALIGDLITRIRAGQTVALHCKGGLGRTGLAAGCCLVGMGLPADQAIATVRAARAGTIETGEQEAYVRRFSLTCDEPRA